MVSTLRKKKSSKLVLLLTIPLGIFAGPELLERWDYAMSDGISRSDIDTKRILRRYEATNDVKEIRHWILHGPAEADATQMCMRMGDWAVLHREQFVSILESLPSKDRKDFTEQFAESLNQSSPREFETAFANNSPLDVRNILRQLVPTRPLSWPTLAPQNTQIL